MRKILSVIMIAVMILAMSTTAFADASHVHEITITGNDGHVYTAYQVFDGDISVVTENGQSVQKFTNIEWGNGVRVTADVNDDDLLSALKNMDNSPYADCKTAEDVAKVLAGFTDDSAELDAFSEVVKSYLITAAGVSSAKEGQPNVSPYTITVSGDGYYFVEDTTAESSMPSGDTRTAYILQVVGDVDVEAKDGEVTSEKKVMDKNDSTGASSEWQDSADYDIGDYIPFKLSAKLPGNYEAYNSYSMTFHDYEWGYTYEDENGKTHTYYPLALVQNDSNHPFVVKVVNVVDGKEVVSIVDEAHYYVDSPGELDNCTFEVVLEDVKGIDAVTNNSEIIVEYYAQLRSTANIGEKGNMNSMHVTYTNDVHQGGEEGTTEEDTVIVFTYKAVVNKVDQNKAPLDGAQFSLYKAYYTGEGADPEWKKVTNATADGDVFTFKGLDDGEYKLVEDVAPAGYNKLDDVFFTVTANHKIETDCLPGDVILTSLSGTGALIEFNGVTTDGSLTAQVVNKMGSTLPSTGGIGTTIFYIAGIILVLAAAVLFVTKRRVGAEK